MFPLVEIGSHFDLYGTPVVRSETTEKLVAVCSEGDAVFEELDNANAAQRMSVPFHKHNLDEHNGAAHMKTPYPVHGT